MSALVRRERHPFERGGQTTGFRFFEIGRDDRIRTCDPHTPSVMRYQAALRPDRAAPSMPLGGWMQAGWEWRLIRRGCARPGLVIARAA